MSTDFSEFAGSCLIIDVSGYKFLYVLLCVCSGLVLAAVSEETGPQIQSWHIAWIDVLKLLIYSINSTFGYPFH